MPLFRRGIFWSVKIWSAVATFLLGLVGAAPQAIAGQVGTAAQGTGAVAVTAQPTAARISLSPANIPMSQETLGQGPFLGTTRWMPPEKGREAFTLAGPWHATNDGGFGQTLNGQTLVLYGDGSAKLFDPAGALLGTRQDPMQLQIFNALKKSGAMVQPTTK